MTVIVKDRTTSERIRKLFEKAKNQISFIPIDNIAKIKPLDQNNKMTFPDIGTPDGFVGYATNLIEISGNNPDLRYIFFNLCGDAIVFETFQQGYDYRQGLLKDNKRCQTIITLDNDKIENNGILNAEKKFESSNRFGHRPFTETSTFKDLDDKKNKLEEYKAILKEKEEFDPILKKVELKYKEMKDKLQKPIDEMNEKLKRLQSHDINEVNVSNNSKRKAEEKDEVSEKKGKKKKVEPDVVQKKGKKKTFVEAEQEEEEEEEKEEYFENSQEEEEEEEEEKKPKKKKK